MSLWSWEFLATPRLKLLAVAALCLLAGLASGWLAPHGDRLPPSIALQQEEVAFGQHGLIIGADPGLDSRAAVVVTGPTDGPRKWVFSFRDPDDASRAWNVARNAASGEYNRVLKGP